MGPGDEQFLGGEAGDYFLPSLGDDDFFFNASSSPTVGRGPESFERKNHARFDLVGMVQRNHSADDWLFPNGQADAVTVLQRERGLFIRKSEFLRLRP